MSFQKPKYQLNIKIVNNIDNLKNYYKNFTYHHNGDSGIDLFNDEIKVDYLKIGTIDFNIQCEMLNLTTNELCSYYLLPRSSISNTGFILANSVGLIDAGYRGNIKAKILNVSVDNDNTLKLGSFFQIVGPTLEPIIIKIVTELTSTSRNAGGFGSTN
jgi:dUTP pyrophosphatase